MSTTYLSLFGTLQVKCNNYTKTVTSQPIGCLLGCLAFYATKNRLVSRAALVEKLWPSFSERQGRQLLSNTLYRLRQEFDNDVPWLLVDKSSLAIVDCETDIEQFMALTRSAQMEDWIYALELYRGDMLSELDCTWLHTPRETLREAYIHSLGCVIETLAQRGDLTGALHYANRWVEEDVINEQAHVWGIQLALRLERHEDARRRYETLADMLAEEFAAQPSEELRASFELASCAVGEVDKKFYPRQRIHSQVNPQILSPTLFEGIQTYDVQARVMKIALAHAARPRGRNREKQTRVLVIWTIDAGEADLAILRATNKVTLRRHRLLRLMDEARLQGAQPTHQELATALNVTSRTIEMDLAFLRL